VAVDAVQVQKPLEPEPPGLLGGVGGKNKKYPDGMIIPSFCCFIDAGEDVFHFPPPGDEGKLRNVDVDAFFEENQGFLGVEFYSGHAVLPDPVSLPGWGPEKTPAQVPSLGDLAGAIMPGGKTKVDNRVLVLASRSKLNRQEKESQQTSPEEPRSTDLFPVFQAVAPEPAAS